VRACKDITRCFALVLDATSDHGINAIPGMEDILELIEDDEGPDVRTAKEANR
jgi:hypothetical protein